MMSHPQTRRKGLLSGLPRVAVLLGVVLAVTVALIALSSWRIQESLRHIDPARPNFTSTIREGEYSWLVDEWRMPWGTRTVISTTGAPREQLERMRDRSTRHFDIVSADVSRWIGATSIDPTSLRHTLTHDPFAIGIVDECGWPWPVVSSAHVESHLLETGVTFSTPIAGAFRSDRGKWLAGIGLPWHLPLRVSLIPFAAMVLLVAVVTMILHRVTARIRARWRRHRQLCERCGYPLASLNRCPECGVAAQAAARSNRDADENKIGAS